MFDFGELDRAAEQARSEMANSAQEFPSKPAEKAERLARQRRLLRLLMALLGSTSFAKELAALIRAKTGHNYPAKTLRNWMDGRVEPNHDGWHDLRATFGDGLFDAVHTPDSHAAEAWEAGLYGKPRRNGGAQ
ncbi:hypothetical protein [Azospirillum brasilense]|nr:hypothetical protein [Azospirillum brasilense]